MKRGFYRTQGQIMMSMLVPVTTNMMPSFRLIAYYHPSDKEVVSDSVWVDVQDSCIGSVRHRTKHCYNYYYCATTSKSI